MMSLVSIGTSPRQAFEYGQILNDFLRLFAANPSAPLNSRHCFYSHKKAQNSQEKSRETSVQRRVFSLKRDHPLPVTRHLPRFLQFFLRLFAPLRGHNFPPLATSNPQLSSSRRSRAARRRIPLHPSSFILHPSYFSCATCHPRRKSL